jgi:hypothetical protein
MRPSDLAITAGLSLITLAVVWRCVRAIRNRRRIAALLRSDDPVARCHGLDILAERGLRSHARQLVRLTMRENNPDVRAALLTAVARTQWEPVDHAALIELRAWARARTAESRARDKADGEALESPGRASRPVDAAMTRDERPLRARPRRDRSLVDRLERILGEPILAVRLEFVDGTVDVDLQAQEEIHCV